MYKWKKGDGKTMAVLVVVCIIAFIWGCVIYHHRWIGLTISLKMHLHLHLYSLSLLSAA